MPNRCPMSDDEAFRDLIRRVRGGDEQASTELVGQFESAIRVAAHVRLTDPGLRRFVDSEDIRQSVLASFFVRVAMGQYELETPAQLVKLWVSMARHKLSNQARQQHAARRDQRRVAKDGSQEAVDPGPGPSTAVANQELLHEVRRRLSAEERQLAEQRAAGRPWKEIAAERGERPDALRMRLERALDRVTQELGLES